MSHVLAFYQSFIFENVSQRGVCQKQSQREVVNFSQTPDYKIGLLVCLWCVSDVLCFIMLVIILCFSADVFS